LARQKIKGGSLVNRLRAGGKICLADKQGLPGTLEVSPGTIISSFPGPAALLDGGGRVLAANAEASTLVSAFHAGRLPLISDALEDLANSDRPQAEKIDLTEIGGETALDITLLPLRDRANGAEPFVLMLSRESTLERNFISALVASRQLFKDLVGCSSDFAWETNADGTLAFVSNRGAIGYSARELYGRLPRAMVVEGTDEGGAFPFEGRAPLENVEVWLFDADGRPACLMTSSVPLVDENGTWKGARGVCRNITDERERTVASERARNRERLLSEIVDAIRTEVEPSRMLEEAARATCRALLADNCWILRTDKSGALSDIAQSVRPIESVPDETINATSKALEAHEDAGVVTLESGGIRVMVAAAQYHDALNGAICISRDISADLWDDDEMELLAGVGDHLGIAIAQI
jgi:PAS domain-containing protein